MFKAYEFEQLPLNRDVFLMDERWRAEWEAAQVDMVMGRDDRVVGFINYIAVRQCGPESAVLSWYPNISERFHELEIRLPREAFVTCLAVPGWDVKPHVFVTGEWLMALHLRPYTAFAMVDAIGVKAALSNGSLSGPALVRLRDKIDRVAADYPHIAFVSFADSLLLKVNWHVGYYDGTVAYSYAPESLIALFPTIASAFRQEIGLDVYAVVTQGANEYEDQALLHYSERGNHVSLNSLGLPFAQLMAIDTAARGAIRAGLHRKAELYIDECFFRSLRLRYGFEKDELPRGTYRAPLASTPGTYFCVDYGVILENLDLHQPQLSSGDA
jgi:hypothetical protein